MRAFGPPALDWCGPMPYPALQSVFDPLYPTGHQWYWRADFVNELTDEAIALHVEHGRGADLLSTMHLYPIDGAGTAWAARTRRVELSRRQVGGGDRRRRSRPGQPASDHRLGKRYWEALHPHSAGGAYVNIMMDEGQERVQATYRDNYDRLAASSSKYDPGNLFRVNQNIRPQA